MTSTHTPISPRPSGFVPPSRHGIRRLEFVMGMPIVFEVCDRGIGPEPVQHAIDWLHWVDATFSTYRDDSEISRLNRGELNPVDVHPDVAAILASCEQLRVATDGYFDISAPYAAGGDGPAAGRGCPDQSIRPASSRGGRSPARSTGSAAPAPATSRSTPAVTCSPDGHPDGDTAWRVGIQHPRSAREIALTLAVSDAPSRPPAPTSAASTSSTRTPAGRPRVCCRSRSPGPTCRPPTPTQPPRSRWAPPAVLAGARRLDGYDAILICADDTVLTTPGIEPLRV